jgi:hypothetical protein
VNEFYFSRKEKFKHRREQLSERRHASFSLILEHRMAVDQNLANFPASHIESSKVQILQSRQMPAVQ